MRRLILLSILFIAFLSYSNADAQTRTTGGSGFQSAQISDAVGFGLRAGYFSSDDASEGAWQVGIHSRFRFGPVLGLEAAVNYQGRQQFTIADGEIEDEERNIRNIPATVSALIHAPLSPYFVPYGLAGVGAYFQFEEFDELLDLDDETSTDFGYHVGGGLEIPASANMAFHADYRRVFLEDGIDLNGMNTTGNMYTAGITWYFG
ncbi:MAG: outer membrane beta-barrel protein [Balneolales bacterium]